MLAAMADTIDPVRSVLVLVDYQSKLLPAIHGGAGAIANAARLADAARLLGIRVVGTEENPAGLGPNDPAIRSRCDATLAKRHFDACGDGLVAMLPVAGRAQPADAVIAGCETHVCLLQTAMGLLSAGLRVFVVADTCGSRSPADRPRPSSGCVALAPSWSRSRWWPSNGCAPATTRGSARPSPS